tara:strand:+ start:1246 stop:1728 length:483 start_codon:yes stop_codon:yes gene_type:complete
MNKVSIIHPLNTWTDNGERSSYVEKEFTTQEDFYNELAVYYRIKNYMSRCEDTNRTLLFKIPNIIDIRYYSNTIVYEYVGELILGSPDGNDEVVEVIGQLKDMAYDLNLVPHEVLFMKKNNNIYILDFEKWIWIKDLDNHIGKWYHSLLGKWQKKNEEQL